MKRIFTLFILSLVCIQFFGQAPQGINYQGVARDAAGNAISKHAVGVEFKIFQSTTNVYSETHTITTDTFGLFSLVIGSGTIVSGTFSTIAWASGSYSIEVDIDPSGGSSYTTVGTYNLESVPFALFAASSGSSSTGVTSVSSTLPISVANPTTTPSLSISQAGSHGNGYLDSTDWNIFNNKGNGTLTNLTNGTGVLFNGSSSSTTLTTTGVIAADNTSPLWNANQLQGKNIASVVPVSGQILQYNGSVWNPTNSSSGTVNSVTLSGGTSFSVTGSPITNSGTITVDFTPQNSGLVLAGPTTAGPAIPTFRALQASDLATGAVAGQVLSTNGTTFSWLTPPAGLPSGFNGQILYNNGTNWLGTPSPNMFFDGVNLGMGTTTPTAVIDINGNNPGAAINAVNNGTGGGIAITGGTTNGKPGLNILENGSVQGAYIALSNTATTSDALFSQTSSTNAQSNAVKGYTSSGGNGVMGWNANQASAQGSGIFGYSTGLGQAGNFVVNYPSNTGPALSASTNGTGNSGIFSGGAGLKTDKIQITNTPVAGYILTSDATGNGTWQAAPSGTVAVSAPLSGTGISANPITLPLATANIFVGNGTTAVGLPMTGDVAITAGGLTKVNGLNGIPVSFGSVTAGQILQYNGSIWTNVSSGILSGGTAGYYPKWISGTGLSSTSLIFDNGTFLGVNSSAPAAALDVYPVTTGTANVLQATNSSTGGIAANFLSNNASNSNVAMQVINSGNGGASNFAVTNASSSGIALQATTSGLGITASFANLNASNTSDVAHFTTGSNGNAMAAINSGTGSAAYFQISNSSSASASVVNISQAGAGPALYSITTGTGMAGNFTISNTSNNSAALSTSTNGTGAAINAVNSGIGTAGSFSITNATSNFPAILANSNATMAALLSQSTGTGGAGLFTISNTSNSSNALATTTNGTGAGLTATNTGTGGAGIFSISNVSSSAAALDVNTNGLGSALYSITSGTGNAGTFNVSNSSSAANVILLNTNGSGAGLFSTTTGSGNAGIFKINNMSSTVPALAAYTNGSGFSGSFSGGSGLQTDKLQVSAGAIQGSILRCTDAAGDAAWDHPVNFSASGSTFGVVPSGIATAISFATTNYDPSGSFSGTNFTAPTNGMYHFTGAIAMNIPSSLSFSADFQIQVFVGGGTYRVFDKVLPAGASGDVQTQISVDAQLTAGQTVSLALYLGFSGASVLNQPGWTYFFGSKF